jgi:hypothetical protein
MNVRWVVAAASPTTFMGEPACALSSEVSSSLRSCPSEQVCVPLSASEVSAAASSLPAGARVGNIGVCDDPLPSPLMLPDASLVAPARWVNPRLRI